MADQAVVIAGGDLRGLMLAGELALSGLAEALTAWCGSVSAV
jgi:hypothetical protein